MDSIYNCYYLTRPCYVWLAVYVILLNQLHTPLKYWKKVYGDEMSAITYRTLRRVGDIWGKLIKDYVIQLIEVDNLTMATLTSLWTNEINQATPKCSRTVFLSVQKDLSLLLFIINEIYTNNVSLMVHL